MRTLKRWHALAVGAALLGACGEAVPEVRVHLRVVDADGHEVSGAEASVDGVSGGATADDGSLWLHWTAAQRGRVEIALRCPEGFRDPPPRRLRARHEGVRRLELVCAATTRSLLLAIDAPGAEGLPVRVDGAEIGEVPPSGVFHAQLRRAVGSEPRVSIDTRTRPGLRPQHPLASVRLDRDEVLVLRPEFHVRRKKRVHRPSAPKEIIPRRLRSL